MTRGELGRAPMALHIIKLILKNWLRIVSYEQDTVLHDTYLAILSLLSYSKSCWLSNIRSLVANKLGETHVWENQGATIHGLIKHLMSQVTNRFNLQWTKALNNKENETGVKNKLGTYNTFKSTFEYENYLDYGSDFRQQKIVTKLRISAHLLEIEVGRHKTKNGQKIPPDKRICNICQTTEDEFHFVMTCKSYVVERKRMLESVEKNSSGFIDLGKIRMHYHDYES